MDCPECNEEKELDCCGSASECRFNFAFLPSVWIKARARLTERTANICDIDEKATRSFIAHKDERNLRPFSMFSPLSSQFCHTLFLSTYSLFLLTYIILFSLSLSLSFKKMVHLCITFGKWKMLFLLLRERERKISLLLTYISFLRLLSVFHLCWLLVTSRFQRFTSRICFQLHVGITTVTAIRRNITVASEWFMISRTRAWLHTYT